MPNGEKRSRDSTSRPIVPGNSHPLDISSPQHIITVNIVSEFVKTPIQHHMGAVLRIICHAQEMVGRGFSDLYTLKSMLITVVGLFLSIFMALERNGACFWQLQY